MADKGFQPELLGGMSSGIGRRNSGGVYDHNQLANRGHLAHVEIDDHLRRLRFTLGQTPTQPSIIQYFDFRQRGWNFVNGDGANPNEDITITLPDAYHDTTYDVLVTVIGIVAGADPTTQTSATALATQIHASARVIDAATFQVRIENTAGANLTLNTRVLFSWVTFGTRRGN